MKTKKTNKKKRMKKGTIMRIRKKSNRTKMKKMKISNKGIKINKMSKGNNRSRRKINLSNKVKNSKKNICQLSKLLARSLLLKI